MRTQTCPQCKKSFEITNPKSNNVKFCSITCRNKAHYQIHKEKHTEYNRNRWNKPWVGKMQCVICGWWFNKVCAHAQALHGVNEKEYKDFLWLDRNKGLVSEAHSDLLRDHALANNMDKQLLKVGLVHRWSKENPPENYERSAQTQERLKWLYKFNKKHNITQS